MRPLAADRCPSCGADSTTPVFRSRLARAVRSDGVGVDADVTIAACPGCGHLHKPIDDVRRWSEYDDYSVFGDVQARDKVEFRDGVPVGRSAVLTAWLRDGGRVGEGTAVLDFGCNRGTFLASLGDGRHAGFDVSERHRPAIDALGFAYHTPSDPPPPESFDVVTLIHVAEHLVDPATDMAPALAALRPGGVVVVQVPDVVGQPSDVYVVDHRSHFTLPALDRAMARAGLRPVGDAPALLGGELTRTYERGDVDAIVSAAPPTAVIDVLTSGESMLLDRRAADRPCVVFGAGLLGALVCRVLGDLVTAVVDDNRDLAGSTLLGHVVGPADGTIDGNDVVVAVQPSAAAVVARRCAGTAARVDVPFPTA